MSRYLVVVAEGGPRNGDKLLVQPLVDGKFLVGRALRADIPIPAEESATGQQHCFVRIQSGAVWLDTLPYQEVYLDAGRPGFQPRRIDTPTSIRLLPQDKLTERVIELGGLARNVDRSGPPFTGIGRTRLRIKLVNGRDAKVETEQTRSAKKRQAAILSSGRRIQFASTTASALMLSLLVVGLTPVWGLLTRMNGGTEVMANSAGVIAGDSIAIGPEEMKRNLDVQDARLSQYYEGIIGAIREQHRRTEELAAAVGQTTNVSAPPYAADNRRFVWAAGVDVGGVFEGVGTAWVLEKPPEGGRLFLITNNNVLATLRARLSEGATPVIRRTDERGETVQHLLDRQALLDQAAAHPDFDPLAAMQRGLRDRVNVFDVARLSLADPAKDETLGLGLRLASPEELQKLSQQTEVGYIGYPHDSLVAGGVRASLPRPVFVRGHISNLSDAFLRSIPDNRWQERQALIVDAVATGGANGSPVFNVEGHVIGLISGENVLHIDESVLSDGMDASVANTGQDPFRALTGFAYVVRSDVVRELARGERPANRSEQWATALSDAHTTKDRVEFTAWKNRYCGDEAPPAHVTNEDKLDANGVYASQLNDVDGKALYISAQIAGGAGRLASLDLIAGGMSAAKPGIPSRLSIRTQSNIRGRENTSLILKGAPLAAVIIDRYSCDLPAHAAEADQ